MLKFCFTASASNECCRAFKPTLKDRIKRRPRQRRLIQSVWITDLIGASRMIRRSFVSYPLRSSTCPPIVLHNIYGIIHNRYCRAIMTLYQSDCTAGHSKMVMTSNRKVARSADLIIQSSGVVDTTTVYFPKSLPFSRKGSAFGTKPLPLHAKGNVSPSKPLLLITKGNVSPSKPLFLITKGVRFYV